MKLADFAEKMNISMEDAKRLLNERLKVTLLVESSSFAPALEQMVIEEFFTSPEPEDGPVPEQETAAEVEDVTIPEKSPESGTPASGQKSPPQKKNRKKKTTAATVQPPAAFAQEDRYGDLLDETKAFLRKCVDEEYMIMVDTCSILEKGQGCKQMAFPLFLEIARPFIEGKKELIIPYVVHEEIEWLSINDEAEALRRKAHEMFKFIERAGMEDKLISIVGKRTDRPKRIKRPYADPIIRSKAGELRAYQWNVLVITQDKNLTLDLMDENNVRSVKSSAVIEVRSLDATGCLVNRKRSELEKGGKK